MALLETMTGYKLLPNDALIAATCKQYGITKIATFDADFERVDFLEVITLYKGRNVFYFFLHTTFLLAVKTLTNLFLERKA